MEIERKNVYIAMDGKEFLDFNSCLNHEISIAINNEEFEKFPSESHVCKVLNSEYTALVQYGYCSKISSYCDILRFCYYLHVCGGYSYEDVYPAIVSSWQTWGTDKTETMIVYTENSKINICTLTVMKKRVEDFIVSTEYKLKCAKAYEDYLKKL